MLQRSKVERAQASVGSDAQEDVLAHREETDVVNGSIVGYKLRECSRGRDVPDGTCRVYG